MLDTYRNVEGTRYGNIVRSKNSTEPEKTSNGWALIVCATMHGSKTILELLVYQQAVEIIFLKVYNDFKEFSFVCLKENDR